MSKSNLWWFDVINNKKGTCKSIISITCLMYSNIQFLIILHISKYIVNIHFLNSVSDFKQLKYRYHSVFCFKNSLQVFFTGS